MKTVRVRLSNRSYPILIQSGALRHVADRLTSLDSDGRVFVISNRKVFRLFGNPLREALISKGFRVSRFLMGDGERFKTLETVQEMYAGMARARLTRRSLVVTLGGQVVGDAGGFAAATYLRGLSYVQIPTTLLAQVDGSIGGKVGVDLPQGKNLVGAFHQPRLVFIDPETLKTLPRRQISAGAAEILKHGIIKSDVLFRRMEGIGGRIGDLGPREWEGIIAASSRIKARIVEADERESGLRAILNYGHTIGHGIEAAMGYRGLLHGEAVSLGMVAAARIAAGMGRVNPKFEERQQAALSSLKLPTRIRRLDGSKVREAMRVDKKILKQKPRFVLPVRIGKVEIREDVPETLIHEAICHLRAR